MKFFPGTDIFQILLCLRSHPAPIFAARPYFYWRDSKSIKSALESMPPPPTDIDDFNLPKECRLHFEHVLEYPNILELSELDDRFQILAGDGDLWIKKDEIYNAYECEINNVCPSNKIGGIVRWMQDPEVPTCTCGRPMEHLLTLTDHEFDGASYIRWLPQEDQRVRPNLEPTIEVLHEANMTSQRRYPNPREVPHEEYESVINGANLNAIFDGAQYVFICRTCPNWPMQAVFQS